MTYEKIKNLSLHSTVVGGKNLFQLLVNHGTSRIKHFLKICCFEADVQYRFRHKPHSRFLIMIFGAKQLKLSSVHYLGRRLNSYFKYEEIFRTQNNRNFEKCGIGLLIIDEYFIKCDDCLLS